MAASINATDTLRIRNEDGRQMPVWLLLLLLVIITFAAFYPALSAYYITVDDPVYLFANNSLAPFGKVWSWDAVKHLFTDASGNYIPLVTLTYAIEKYFFAPDTLTAPFIFHLDNVLIHIGCTICTFFLFLKLDVKKWGAFIGALLFGIHPMRVESVAWVTERKDVLYGLFFLLSLITYINYIKSTKNNTTWYLVTWLFALLSCLAKVQAVCLPLCMVALDVYFDRKWLSPKVLLVEKLPWWQLSLTFGIVNVYILASQKIFNIGLNVAHYNFIDKLAIGAYAYTMYLVKFIYPYQMLALYPYPIKMPVIAYVLIVVVLASFVLLLWRAKQHKVLLLGIALFTCSVVFVLQVLPSGNTFMADRYTYIGYTGLFFIVAKGYEWVIRYLRQYKLFINIALGLYLSLFAFMTFNQNKVWQNTVSLWTHYTEVKPDDYYGYYQLAGYYMDVMLSKLPDPHIDTTHPLNTLPLQYMQITEIKDSLNGRPSAEITSNILFNHGVAYEFTYKIGSAVNEYTKALNMDPNMKAANQNRAYDLYLLKRYDLAEQDFLRAEQMDPGNDVNYYRHSVCEMTLQKPVEALKCINKALQVNSGNPEYYISRATYEKSLDLMQAMQADIETAKQLGGTIPPALLQ